MKRVEAVNDAIRGLPADRIRLHLCWGSWHGPHTTDLPIADIVDVLFAINAGAYSSEAANARHEHEWKVWRDVKLPDGKVILPGVITHSANVVEHPELVADRIVRFAEAAGRENVVASTGCGQLVQAVLCAAVAEARRACDRAGPCRSAGGRLVGERDDAVRRWGCAEELQRERLAVATASCSPAD